ncbi:hypothetical protein CU098_010004, partial [Rhizopus stolonifer]
MPISEFDQNSLIAKVNNEPCLVNFLDSPLIYQHKDLDVTVDYYSVNDLPPNLRDWTFNLVKSNLYD